MKSLISFEFSEKFPPSHSLFQENFLKDKLGQLLNTLERPDIGFLSIIDNDLPLKECEKIYRKFQERKQFIHIGIGGSSLGPEMLIHALKSEKNNVTFHFINNVDPTLFKETLDSLSSGGPEELEKCLFYFVSKSGGTAETMAALAIISNWLKERGIKEQDFKNYLVFATDPEKGDLRKIAKDLSLSTLDIPPNVGGRYSVLTPVGLFPALFAGIKIENLFLGAKKIRSFLFHPSPLENSLLITSSFLQYLKVEKFINQTVLMPYSSRLKDFSHWFVQLWAESLGKKKKGTGKENSYDSYEGFTPIPAVGATDQHSQLQLFMEGPIDKCIIFLETKNFPINYPLSNDFSTPSMKKLAPYSLNQLIQAELEGTIQGLREVQRPFIRLSIPEVSEESLGALILFFETLTVLMGHHLHIDPFDQPGVEASKLFAFKWLNNLES